MVESRKRHLYVAVSHRVIHALMSLNEVFVGILGKLLAFLCVQIYVIYKQFWIDCALIITAKTVRVDGGVQHLALCVFHDNHLTQMCQHNLHAHLVVLESHQG